MKKTLVTILVILTVLTLSSGVMAQRYVVGTNASFPPFEYVEEGEIVGFDIDLVKEIAKLQGFEVEFRDISFDSLIPGLASGSLDMVAAGMTITEARKEVVAFSDPYYSANQSVLVHEESEEDLTVLFGSNDVGVQTGTTGDTWVRDKLIERDILTGELRNYDSYVFVIRDLANKNIDAAVLDKPVAETYSKDNPVNVVAEVITGEEYGIAVGKNNQALLEEVNAGLAKVIENGTMDELIEKYFE
ncbi:amino acid ABC transporter substrate-binding protein (PAAT family) [Halanaerobium saccharolyticum]|jgi:polar amino acid transport system substrate-binding protein|uniref:Amino acid ABC transporter substrate-binding protein (PAAT family) n=1 Tax=Halanaerobium saccharolyticum TaxID=43595 RepID=A0A2T5REZ6_9FIRM|nr:MULTISPECIES: basic amino acid ABC transporter substrate-binding protein [Halanaerobium]PTV92658.1 amino acid ABC transporter substrate-binding protein (PAAT family) [Halanaerobium saccharolyticum]PUU88494.1 MAG: amino acid ABC transporter substrate-binding protein [Halanaerobium sp.]PUU94289.1 MAG: amino acid ABC transporter substrate-binding protein [Halanaerobium sp.]TDQ01740.1 amino acid ABC transporter substrate-binding protein (PAAT family) [Halanaerobium saccharolyticum]